MGSQNKVLCESVDCSALHLLPHVLLPMCMTSFCSTGLSMEEEYWTELDPNLQVGVVKNWMGRRKLGKVISLNLRTQAAFTDLQVFCAEDI